VAAAVVVADRGGGVRVGMFKPELDLKTVCSAVRVLTFSGMRLFESGSWAEATKAIMLMSTSNMLAWRVLQKL